MKRILTLMMTALLLTVTAGCGSDDSNPSADSGGSSSDPILIGTINNFPPFAYEEGGKLTGFDIDLIQAILDEQRLQGEFRVMGFDGIITALQSKQIAIALADISVTEERKAVVDFSDSYYEDGQSIAVEAGSDIASLEDLKGKTIVATQGTTGLQAAQEIADKYGAKVQTLTSSDALFLAVTSGQADALAIDTSSIQYKIKQDEANPSVQMLEENVVAAPTAIAVTKGNEDLIEELNEGLQKLKDNGTYDELYAKYLG